MMGAQRTISDPSSRRRPRRIIWIVTSAVVAFFIWATYAPLEIIVRGEGRVVPSMNTQIIQNLEGGIVRQIFVVEGDEVDEGDLLLQMDATQFESAFQELQEQRLSLFIRLQRLEAEASRETDFEPSPQYRTQAPEYAASELALFRARREELTGTLTTFTELVRLRRREVDLLRPMVDQSAVPEIDLLRAEQIAIESEGRVVSLLTEFETQRAQSYAEALTLLRQVEEQIQARQDQLSRTRIISPVRGIINSIEVTTVGGVVGSGDPLIEILPLDQPLRIEGRIAPRDIASVVAGMDASIKLTAFDFAIYGTLQGQVVHVGADTLIDERQQNPQPYYEVFIELDGTTLEGPDGVVEIRPGMLGVVELDAGSRTVLQYLLKPLFRSSEALRER